MKLIFFSKGIVVFIKYFEILYLLLEGLVGLLWEFNVLKVKFVVEYGFGV